MRREAAAERETAVKTAVKAAHSQWLAQHKHSIQVVHNLPSGTNDDVINTTNDVVQAAVEEAKRESEPVLTASQVHSMIQTTVAAVKKDFRQMVIQQHRILASTFLKAISSCIVTTPYPVSLGATLISWKRW